MKNLLGYNEESIVLCNDFIDDVDEALGLIYSKDTAEQELGEQKIKTTLVKLTGLLLNNNSVSVRVYPKLDLWDFQVTFVFDMIYAPTDQFISYSRSTRCVDVAKSRLNSAGDICVDTVSCAVAVTRSFVQDVIKAPAHDDIFRAMPFVAGHSMEPYL